MHIAFEFTLSFYHILVFSKKGLDEKSWLEQTVNYGIKNERYNKRILCQTDIGERYISTANSSFKSVVHSSKRPFLLSTVKLMSLIHMSILL